MNAVDHRTHKHIGARRTLFLLAFLVISVFSTPLVAGSDPPALTKEQISQFLRNARVVSGRVSAKGITHPVRLTLSDGAITHDASFQAVDERKAKVLLSNGQVESNFVDSYKYNIGAYALAEMVGFDDMMPVYVERTWNGMTGSLSWWLPVMMDDQERYLRQIQPPDMDRWNRQIEKLRLFNQLVEESDPNLTNILIGKDWQVWRIDFSRAFRLQTDVQIPKDLQRCERRFFERLKALDGNELESRTKDYLTAAEVHAVLARRDKIVAYFQHLIAEKGEGAVLY